MGGLWPDLLGLAIFLLGVVGLLYEVDGLSTKGVQGVLAEAEEEQELLGLGVCVCGL